jgi:hypothetical protein
MACFWVAAHCVTVDIPFQIGDTVHLPDMLNQTPRVQERVSRWGHVGVVVGAGHGGQSDGRHRDRSTSSQGGSCACAAFGQWGRRVFLWRQHLW